MSLVPTTRLSAFRKPEKSEADEELIQAYHGTILFPFQLSRNNRIAVKHVYDRGIGNLKVTEVG